MEVVRLNPDSPREKFSCGDSDLDEFYSIDSKANALELLSVTYAFTEGDTTLAFFSLSNDSIKKEDTNGSGWRRAMKMVPHEKRYSGMPAAKIGRLAVCETYKGRGIGTKILDYLKVWFTADNKTGCRFLVVDAYNVAQTIHFYEKNGFKFLTSVDEREKTRIMYFDLMQFRA